MINVHRSLKAIPPSRWLLALTAFALAVAAQAQGERPRFAAAVPNPATMDGASWEYLIFRAIAYVGYVLSVELLALPQLKARHLLSLAAAGLTIMLALLVGVHSFAVGSEHPPKPRSFGTS